MSTKNWTFALLKPDAVANPISLGWLLDALNKNGLIIEMDRLSFKFVEKSSF